VKRALGGFAVLACALAPGARAQKIQVGGQVVFGDYREQTASLHYTGAGPGAFVAFSRRKLSGDVAVARLSYDPASGSGATQSFHATQIDVHLRWYLASSVSAELGWVRRTTSPEVAAQEMGAVRIGMHAFYGLGPGADLTLRANYLAGAKFSGGGSAPFGIELGLGVSYGATNARWRLTGDYEFQRVDRKTSVPVPLQQSLARVGAALGF